MGQTVVNGTMDFLGKGTSTLIAGDLSLSSGGKVEDGLGSLNVDVSGLNNAGTISSNGSLNVDVRGSNAIVNSGLMESSNGNVTIDVPKSENLVFNGTGGTVQALNGAMILGIRVMLAARMIP